jgi:hypothetical protein
VEAKWTVLETFTDGRRKCWVRCSCGAKEIRREDHILSGRTKSCKSCASKKTAATHGTPIIYKGTGDLSATFWGHIKECARKRGLFFNIKIDDGWALFIQQQKRCALSDAPLVMCRESKNSNVDWSRTTASLDRINSKRGYVLDNVQWVHKTVNYIKRDLDQGAFIRWCQLIAQGRTQNGA